MTIKMFCYLEFAAVTRRWLDSGTSLKYHVVFRGKGVQDTIPKCESKEHLTANPDDTKALLLVVGQKSGNDDCF